MLGIRLSAVEEQRLTRHARETGQPKSTIARDWIVERLDREEIDELIGNAAKLHASDRQRMIRSAELDSSDAHLRLLDAMDGGYDWGPDGPPDPL